MKTGFLTAAVLAGTCGMASATVLTFDPNPGNGSPINGAYGDRVTSAMQGGFAYGTMFGQTPNVEVSYSSFNGNMLHWSTDYGDLQDVIYAPESAREFRVTLEADAGWLVELHAFDLAGWANTDYTINGVRVEVDGSVEFSEMNALVRGASADMQNRRHTSYDFGAALTGSVVEIVVDVANIVGASQDNIGIDNVAFGQVVPAPGAVAVLGAAGLVAVRRR